MVYVYIYINVYIFQFLTVVLIGFPSRRVRSTSNHRNSSHLVLLASAENPHATSVLKIYHKKPVDLGVQLGL